MTPDDLRARGGLKWTYYDEDVLAAWVAEMDFGLAPEIAESLHEAVDRGDTAYFYPDAARDVALAATGYWSDRFDWVVEPERVFSAPDVVEGIRRAIVHLTTPGSPVVLHTPVYFPFFSMVERAGRTVIEAPATHEGGRYRLNLDEIDRALADGAGSVVFCNPWNPVGRSFTEDEIGDLIDIVTAHGARLIVDEIHAPLVYEDVVHRVTAAYAPEAVVTVTSASKAWNLPGLKCAQIVLTNDEDVEHWTSYYTADKVGVGTFGLFANSAAYSHSRGWLDDVLDRLGQNRQLLGELLTAHAPEVGYEEPEGTYLAWLDFGSYGLDDPAAYLLEEAHVALTDGGPFGRGGSGHARLNFATEPHILAEMVERVGKAL